MPDSQKHLYRDQRGKNYKIIIIIHPSFGCFISLSPPHPPFSTYQLCLSKSQGQGPDAAKKFLSNNQTQSVCARVGTGSAKGQGSPSVNTCLLNIVVQGSNHITGWGIHISFRKIRTECKFYQPIISHLQIYVETKKKYIYHKNIQRQNLSDTRAQLLYSVTYIFPLRIVDSGATVLQDCFDRVLCRCQGSLQLSTCGGSHTTAKFFQMYRRELWFYSPRS